MSSAAKRITSGLQTDVRSRSSFQLGIVTRKFQKKNTKAHNPAFGELTLDNLARQLHAKDLTKILGVTHNETVYGPESVTRKILLDLYPIIKQDFSRHKVSIDVSDNETSNDVLVKVIKAYDKIHPDWVWSIERKLHDSNIPCYIRVERDYDKVAPVRGYSPECYWMVDLQKKNPLIFNAWLIIMSLFKNLNKIYCWFELAEHEMVLEYLQQLIDEPRELDEETSKEFKETVQEMKEGSAYMIEHLLENSEFCINDLILAKNQLKRTRKIVPLRNEMISLIDFALPCLTSGKQIGDFLQISPVSDPELFEDQEPLTMHDYMKFIWRAEGNYWEEVNQMGQERWNEHGDGYGFNDVFDLTQSNPKPPERDPFPAMMATFFDTACDFVTLVEKQYSPLLIHKLK